MAEYHHGKLKQKDKETIDGIRKSLKINPRVIMLTTDKKEFAIYDGWHTAMAFALEEREIPVFLGVADHFKCYK